MDENEKSKVPDKVRENTLKVFPSDKDNKLNHYVIPTFEEFDYDCAVTHVGINDSPNLFQHKSDLETGL